MQSMVNIVNKIVYLKIHRREDVENFLYKKKIYNCMVMDVN